MHLNHPVSILFCLATAVLADVQFTAPPPGSTSKGGDILTAHWKDSGELPQLSELATYDLYLCAGGASTDSIEEVALLIQNGQFERGNSVSFQVDRDVGGTFENAYFLKMLSRGEQSSVINYSERFTLEDMTGSFSERVLQGLYSLTNGTQSHDDLKKRQAAGVAGVAGAAGAAGAGAGAGAGAAGAGAAGAGAAGLGAAAAPAAAPAAAAPVAGLDMYTVPYPLQTGLTRYAPMVKHPGTTITAKSDPPQFPASPYVVATTFLPIPTIQTTLTASNTYSTSSIENPATPAPHPANDMKRFLKRWADDE